MIDKIYSLFLNEIDFLNDNSYFAHQDMKNTSGCGALVEIALRKLIQEAIGQRFKVTHGYIYSSQYNKLSPQIDIIITDTLVPHCLKRFDYLNNLEIIPVESVVGLFEVKRTLNSITLEDAYTQLETRFDSIPLQKDLGILVTPGGVEEFGCLYSNPLIGIISIQNEIKDLDLKQIPWFIDTIFNCQDFFIALCENNQYVIKPCRPANKKVPYKKITNHKKEDRLQMFICYLLAYLGKVAGRKFDPNLHLKHIN